MAVDPIEEWVVKIDNLDVEINHKRQVFLNKPLTEVEFDELTANILLREKLNNELKQMRAERSRRQTP